MLEGSIALIGFLLFFIGIPTLNLIANEYAFNHKTPIVKYFEAEPKKEIPPEIKRDDIKLTFDYKTYFVLHDGKFIGTMNDNTYLMTLKGFKSEVERLAKKLTEEPEYTILGEDNISYVERDLDSKQKTLDLLNERFRELNEFRNKYK